MRLRWHKGATVLVMAGYLLAIVFAATHSHVHIEGTSHPCGHASHAHDAHDVHAADCCHPGHEATSHGSPCHETSESAWEPMASFGESHQDCPICQFLAQKWMPIGRAESVRPRRVVWHRPDVRARYVPTSPLFTWRVRGPPIVA